MQALIGREHTFMYNSVWGWHDNPISAAGVGLSCRVLSLPSFQALRPCSTLKPLRTQREVPLLAIVKKIYDETITEFGFDNSWYHAQSHPIIALYFLYSPDGWQDRGLYLFILHDRRSVNNCSLDTIDFDLRKPWEVEGRPRGIRNRREERQLWKSVHSHSNSRWNGSIGKRTAHRVLVKKARCKRISLKDVKYNKNVCSFLVKLPRSYGPQSVEEVAELLCFEFLTRLTVLLSSNDKFFCYTASKFRSKFLAIFKNMANNK